MLRLQQILQKLKQKWLDIIKEIIDGSCGCVREVKVFWNLPEWESCEGCKQETYSETFEFAVFFNDHAYNYRFGLGLNESTCKIIFNLTNKNRIKDAVYFTIDDVKYERFSEVTPCGFNKDYEYYYLLLKKC